VVARASFPSRPHVPEPKPVDPSPQAVALGRPTYRYGASGAPMRPPASIQWFDHAICRVHVVEGLDPDVIRGPIEDPGGLAGRHPRIWGTITSTTTSLPPSGRRVGEHLQLGRPVVHFMLCARHHVTA